MATPAALILPPSLITTSSDPTSNTKFFTTITRRRPYSISCIVQVCIFCFGTRRNWILPGIKSRVKKVRIKRARLAMRGTLIQNILLSRGEFIVPAPGAPIPDSGLGSQVFLIIPYVTLNGSQIIRNRSRLDEGIIIFARYFPVTVTVTTDGFSLPCRIPP